MLMYITCLNVLRFSDNFGSPHGSSDKFKMTDYQACFKYFAEFRAASECGILMVLDENLSLIKLEIIYEELALSNKMFDLYNAKKNYVQIYNFADLNTFQYVGESQEYDIDVLTGRIIRFAPRRKKPIDLKTVAKEFEKMQSGVFLPWDEERCKYSS